MLEDNENIEKNRQQVYEDLKYIKQIIDDSRSIIIDNGIEYIVWGILVILGLLSTYIEIIKHGEQYNTLVWIVLVSFGWGYSIYQAIKRKKSDNKITFAGKIVNSVWITAGINMTILGFAGTYSGAIKPVFISPVFATILGMAYYISSMMYDIKILKILAPMWWAGSIFLFLFPGIHTILVMAGLMLFLQVVPGIIIYKRFNDSKEVNG